MSPWSLVHNAHTEGGVREGSRQVRGANVAAHVHLLSSSRHTPPPLVRAQTHLGGHSQCGTGQKRNDPPQCLQNSRSGGQQGRRWRCRQHNPAARRNGSPAATCWSLPQAFYTEDTQKTHRRTWLYGEGIEKNDGWAHTLANALSVSSTTRVPLLRNVRMVGHPLASAAWGHTQRP